MAQFGANDALQNLMLNLNNKVQTASTKTNIELFAFKRAPEINSIQANNALNLFEMTNRVTQLIDIKTEQRKDPALRKFMP